MHGREWKVLHLPLQIFCVNVSGQKINTSEFFTDILRCKENFTKGTCHFAVLNRPYIALISAQIIDELNLKYNCGIIGNQLVINAILRC